LQSPVLMTMWLSTILPESVEMEYQQYMYTPTHVKREKTP
jgi:hypothetical protein